MIVNFNDMNDEKLNLVPQHVIDSIVPDNFECVKNGDKYILKIKDLRNNGHVRFDVDLDKIDKNTKSELLKIDNPYKQFMFLSTKMGKIPVKNFQIGDGKKFVNLEKIDKDIFDGSIKVSSSYIEFSKYRTLNLKINDTKNHSVNLILKCDDITLKNQVWSTIKPSGLNISIFVYKDDMEKSHFSYNFSVNKCKDSKEVLNLLHVFKSILNGTASFNGDKFYGIHKREGDVSIIDIENMISFWDNITKLERKFNISFNPQIKINNDDEILLRDIIDSYINNNDILCNNRINSLHVRGTEDISKFKNIIGKEGTVFTFLNGPITYKIMGAEMPFYLYYIIKNFIITEVKELDDNEGEIFIKDSKKASIQLTKKFFDEKMYQEYCNCSDKTKYFD